MTPEQLDYLRFPIGKFARPQEITKSQLRQWIHSIASFPEKLAKLTSSLSSEQKNWLYRPKGWSIKQVVHHCADSHTNSLIRFKWALTEEQPLIKTYFEERWATLPDSLDDDLGSSLLLLQGLHGKWSFLLKQLSEEDLERCFIHPEQNNKVSLKEAIGIYAWHGEHHLAHIRIAIESNGCHN